MTTFVEQMLVSAPLLISSKSKDYFMVNKEGRNRQTETNQGPHFSFSLGVAGNGKRSKK